MGVDTPMHTMKLDALLHKTCTKVLRLNMGTSMISFRKIAHQMWHEKSLAESPIQPKKPDNKMSSRTGVWRKLRRRGWTKCEKWGVRQ